MPLTREEIKQCRDSFDSFDKDGGGTVDVMELKVILNGLGALPSDEELQLMIQQVE
jgi:Ca2+-binding EF-hand superfamily protein